MREMKDSGIPWIGEIPKEWQVNMLSSLFDEHKQKNKDLAETNLLSLSYGKIVRKDINTKEGLLPESFDGYNVISKGDIVFRLTDLQNDKRSLRTGLCLEKGIITSAYVTIRERAPLNSSYFHYLLHSYDLCKVFYGMGDGVRQGMNYSDLRKLLVLQPSLAEQQRIAEFLDRKCAEVDEMIGLQEQIIEELKAYKQSVITEAVTKGLNPDAPMRDSGIEWIGQIPAHWEVKRLKFIAERHNQKVSDEVLPYIGLENVESFSERFIETENEYDITQAQVCAVGDVIFGKLRPYLGKAMVIKTEHCCSSEFLVLSGSGAPSYLRYLMLSDWFVEIVNASTYGTKMPRANADYIMNMQVVCPSIEERKAIADYLDEKCADIDSLIQTKLSKIDSLKEYKKSIIYEYVTGKREVE